MGPNLVTGKEIQENKYREKKRKSSNNKQSFIMFSASATHESFIILWCTIWILAYVVTHHQQTPNPHNQANMPNVATPQTTSLA